MTRVFVDTAGWIACGDVADPAHTAACGARDAALEAGRTLVTTDFVVDETLTLMRLRLGSREAEAWWHQIDSSRRLHWERIDAARFDRAREFFFRHRDKSFSFTDCTSFVVMRELRLTDVLTTDHHFRQAGFSLLATLSAGPKRRSRGPTGESARSR